MSPFSLRSLGEAGWQLLETRLSESENTEPQTLQPEYQYVWSVRYMDAPVLRDENTDTNDLCDDQRLYYANDANMNVTALIGTDGTPLERYAYDPYGKVTVLDADFSDDADGKSDYDNSILFAGYYRDNETGLCHVRNRYYHPQLGWITRDPAGYADGMSLYQYVGSGPLGATDPMGLCTDSPEKIAEDLKNGKIKSAKELKERIEKLPKGQRGEAVRRAQEELRGWQPKNEGPVRRGGGGGDGDGVWSWERGVKDYGNPLAEKDMSLAEALALRLAVEFDPTFVLDIKTTRKILAIEYAPAIEATGVVMLVVGGAGGILAEPAVQLSNYLSGKPLFSESYYGTLWGAYVELHKAWYEPLMESDSAGGDATQEP